ncbi:hypothetical protein BH10PAT1_BH10PAT1_3800 [soil metagenome]
MNERTTCIPSKLDIFKDILTFKLNPETIDLIKEGLIVRKQIYTLEINDVSLGDKKTILYEISNLPQIKNNPYALNEVGGYFNHISLHSDALLLFGSALLNFGPDERSNHDPKQIVKRNYIYTLRTLNQNGIKLKRQNWKQATANFNLVIQNSTLVLDVLDDSDILSEQITAGKWLDSVPNGFRKQKRNR